MSKEANQSLAKIKKLADAEKQDQKGRFMRVKHATELYKLSRPTLMKMAVSSGALYKIDSTVLINTEIFERYLETFRIPGEIQ